MLEAGLALPPLDPEVAVLQPLGVFPTRGFRQLCDQTPDEQRGEAHLCAFFDRGSRACKIWRFRPGECSTYFCTQDSQRANRESTSLQFFALESGLAQMALAHLGFSRKAIGEQVDWLNAPPEKMVSLPQARAEEIYARSWAWARSQSPGQVQAWLPFDKNPPGG